MSTWQMVTSSSSAIDIRWEMTMTSYYKEKDKDDAIINNNSFSLPSSMEHLLIQAVAVIGGGSCSNNNNNINNLGVVTGEERSSGSSTRIGGGDFENSNKCNSISKNGGGIMGMTVKQSSITKARSLLSPHLPNSTGFSNQTKDPHTSSTFPMFQNGLGKTITLKHSSITKALSILGDDSALTGCSDVRESLCPSKFQSTMMFRSGLGKPVTVKQSSVTKTLSVCGDEGGAIFDNPGNLPNGSHEESSSPNSMFQTGSGKKVIISSAGLSRAKSLLKLPEHLDPDIVFGTEQPTNQSNDLFIWQNFSSESKKGANTPCYEKTPPLAKLSVKSTSFQSSGDLSKISHEEGSFPNSMFQTGSGKKVSISSAGLSRAKSLLGLPEHFDSDNIFGTEQPKNQSNDLFGWQNTSLESKEGANTPCYEKTPPLAKLSVNNTSLQSSGDLSNISHEEGSFPNSMFQTGSGEKVNISSAGLSRAKSFLGLSEHVDSDNVFGAEQPKNQSNDHFGWQKVSSEIKEGANIPCYEKTPPLAKLSVKNTSFQSGVKSEPIPNFVNSGSKCPSIKFQSAGGKSISVSNDALQRAKRLLGDLEDESLFGEGVATSQSFSFCKQGGVSDNYSHNRNSTFSTINPLQIDKGKCSTNGFVSPLRSLSNQRQSPAMSEKFNLRNNLIDQFDAEDQNNNNKTLNTHIQNKIPNSRSFSHNQMNNHLENSVKSIRTSGGGRSCLGVPLGDISNKVNIIEHKDERINGGLKRRLVRSSVSPFKKPRSTRFITPLKNSVPSSAAAPPHPPIGRSSLAVKDSSHRRRISTHYPFQGQRKYAKEYFGKPPLRTTKMLNNLPDHVRSMSPESANKFLFPDEFGVQCIGAQAFYHMLIESGASMEFASKKWVANHYKWIVWKLACYERCCPCKDSGKLFTVNNVLQDLKLRYEREVNHNHRSAIKRILEGDQPPSSAIVLCISAIRSNYPVTPPMSSKNIEQREATMVEVTDGWYSVNAFLDVHLSKKLAAGKLFVGQKLRIWGAGLCGWEGPISPLEESSMVGLFLHINGTYRAHWATRLGLCEKSGNVPLALRCINGTGGPVPCTLVGVTRIYPLQYRERLSNGKSIVRSDRMEAKMAEQYSQRRSSVAEGVISDFQDKIRNSYYSSDDSNMEEGARILKMLETAAEPEYIMAGMSAEQLYSFTCYKTKLEERRQSDMHNSIETALDAAGLSARDVTPFMRVRVVGLTSVNSPQKSCNTRNGIITIWNPCVNQQSELVEGKSYAVTGLIPLDMEADTLYLQTRGSTTKWVPLSVSSAQHFELFFSPRQPVMLSQFGKVPLSSEFDIAAFVIYVGDVYTDVNQKKQWLFVADGSVSGSSSEEPPNSLLAISFSSPCIDCILDGPVSNNLVGSAVGFCNLVKRATDQINHIWVADATTNSAYFLNYDDSYSSHLKEAATSARRWANMSSSKVEKLRQKVMYVIGKNEGETNRLN